MGPLSRKGNGHSRTSEPPQRPQPFSKIVRIGQRIAQGQRRSAMRVCRALLLAALIVVTPFGARAQFGGMPGLPGGTPGGVPGTGGFGAPNAPPPACQQLLALRDETQKHGMAIQKANERKATVQDACQLFKTFLVAEAKFIRGLEDNSRTCGVPPDAIKQAKEGHAKAEQVAKQVCDAAAQGTRPRGPTGDFFDSLGPERVPYRRDPWDVLREGSQKQGQSKDHNCFLCWTKDDSVWPDKRNPLPGPR